MEIHKVVFGSFKGGHMPAVMDPGSDENWIVKKTWDFLCPGLIQFAVSVNSGDYGHENYSENSISSYIHIDPD